jgi:hypothetical protein
MMNEKEAGDQDLPERPMELVLRKTQQTRSRLPSTFFIPCSIFDISFILPRPMVPMEQGKHHRDRASGVFESLGSAAWLAFLPH